MVTTERRPSYPLSIFEANINPIATARVLSMATSAAVRLTNEIILEGMGLGHARATRPQYKVHSDENWICAHALEQWSLLTM